MFTFFAQVSRNLSGGIMAIEEKKSDFEKRKSEISYLSPKSPKDQHTYSKCPSTGKHSGNFKVCQIFPDQKI